MGYTSKLTWKYLLLLLLSQIMEKGVEIAFFENRPYNNTLIVIIINPHGNSMILCIIRPILKMEKHWRN